MRTRIGFSLLSLVVAATLLLSACTSSSTAVNGRSAEGAQFAKFFDQRLVWKPCESTGLTCTKVTTPIDWAKPAGGTIRLAVIRHATASPARVGSLLVNPGGPGGSGYEMVRDGLDYFTSTGLRKSFDVVGWDPRGVGKSSPITCLDGRAMDSFLYGVSPHPEGSDAWLQERVGIEKAYGEACRKNTGALLGHVDAESNARDMNLLRAVLGDKKLNYLGFSYGTFFGAHYAKLFPKNVGRLVLDGPIDPSVAEPQDFTTQMGGFESAYRAFIADCLSGEKCPFTGTVDDALTQSRALIQKAGTAGLTIGDGRTLDLGTLGTAISYPLYSRDSWPGLSDMFTQLQAGKATLAFQLADGYNGRDSYGNYSGANNVYTAALCLDGEYPPTLAGTRETMNSIAAAAPTIGAIFSYGDWVQVSIACQNWPYRSVLKAEKITARGADPIMVVGTTNDPATPYVGAEALAAELASGFLVTRRGEGHTAYASGNACIDETVDAYLVKGTVPSKDPQC